MATINLFGASGHAKVIKDIIVACEDNVGCLYDDAPHCDEICGSPVYKASEVNIEGPLIVSIGANRVRKLISEKYPTPIHKGQFIPNLLFHHLQKSAMALL